MCGDQLSAGCLFLGWQIPHYARGRLRARGARGRWCTARGKAHLRFCAMDSGLWCLRCVLPAGWLRPERRAGREKESPKALISRAFVKIDGLAKRLKKRSFRVLLEGKAVREHSLYQTPESPSQMVEDVVNEVS